MTQIIDGTVERYLRHFKQFEESLNGGSKLPVHALRKSAITRFSESGFPTTKLEDWRFTNVAPLKDVECVPDFMTSVQEVSESDLQRCAIGGNDIFRLVFVNGRYVESASTPPVNMSGVFAGSLGQALSDKRAFVEDHLGKIANVNVNPFTALNTAFIEDGACILVDDGIELPHAIHLLFLSASKGEVLVAHPRNLIVAGKRSRVSIVESYVALHSLQYFTNVVTEMFVGEEAIVEHDKLQTENAGAFHVGSAHIRLAAKSTVTSNTISLGGAIVRNDVHAHLGGEYSECTLNGLSLATGTQLIDNHTAIDHAVPNCSSHELYKSILDGKSRGVFNGKIFVRKDAQKTDAKQTNKTLLLSDEATIDTKPQLEIFADDVKCTHGATVGQLDEDQVFYLRARGIGLDEARDILTFAFAQDVVSRIHVDELRSRLEEMIHHRLNHGRLTQDL